MRKILIASTIVMTLARCGTPAYADMARQEDLKMLALLSFGEVSCGIDAKSEIRWVAENASASSGEPVASIMARSRTDLMHLLALSGMSDATRDDICRSAAEVTRGISAAIGT